MTSGLLLQVLVTGLAAGAAYGLVAVGLCVAYSLTGIANLAHGDLGGGAVFTALFVAAGTAPVAAVGVAGWRMAFAIAGAVFLAGLVGALVYAGGVRPFLRRSSVVGWAGALAAVSFAIQGIVAASFVRQASAFPEWVPFGHSPPVRVGGAVIPARDISVLVIGLILAVTVELVLSRSEIGLALRAVSADRVGAAVVGMRIDRLVMGAFAVVAALAAFAALTIAPAAPVLPVTGVLLGVKGMVAATLGGWTSTRRVFVAALLLGGAEAAIVSLHVPGLPNARLGPAWRDVVPLFAALLMLAWRPPAFARERAE